MSRVPFLAPPLLYVPPPLWFKQTPLMLTKASLRQLQHLPCPLGDVHYLLEETPGDTASESAW